MEAIVWMFVCTFCCLYSIWLRTNRYRQEIKIESKISPISLAVQDLVAVAGGIYLSLIMLISFLKITVPERICVFSIDVEPLAFIAICLGVIQPIVLNLIKKVK